MASNITVSPFASLNSVVVDYAVVVCEQTLDTEDAPQIDRIRKMEGMVLNQTDSLVNEIESLNQTDTQPIDQIVP